MRFEIIWPKVQIVDEETIRTMYAQAVAEQQLPIMPGGIPKNADDMAEALHDAAIITLGEKFKS